MSNIIDVQKTGQQSAQVGIPHQSSPVDSNEQQTLKNHVTSQLLPQTEKKEASPHNAQEEHPLKVKQRLRLTNQEQYDLAIRALKLINAGFSLKAVAFTLSFPEERLFPILVKNNLLDQANFQSLSVLCVDELKQFFQNKFGTASLVNIREEGESFLITKHKNNVKGENNE